MNPFHAPTAVKITSKRRYSKSVGLPTYCCLDRVAAKEITAIGRINGCDNGIGALLSRK
jgi:hypothetical protein